MALKNGRLKSEINNTLILGNTIPVGTVAPLATDTVPDGWLFCNGDTQSRTTYSKLFEVIGTRHGSGDGSTTFHLPDYRGRFLRGQDAGAGRDPGGRTHMNAGGATLDNVGSVQNYTLGTHTHGANTNARNGSMFAQGTINSSDNVGVRETSTPSWTTNERANGGSVSGDTTQSVGVIVSGATANNNSQTGTNEVRPLNANVKYIIKV